MLDFTRAGAVRSAVKDRDCEGFYACGKVAPMQVPSVPDLNEWYVEDAGFEHPDWEMIGEWIATRIPKEHWNEAWMQAARHWLGRVQRRLGPQFRLGESGDFLLVSSFDERRQNETLGFLQQTLKMIRRILGDLAFTDYLGKHACIVFEGDRRYYEYVSHFYPDEGEFAGSGGMFINAGYTHIVLPGSDPAYFRPALIHELVHNCVSHLPLPPWLNEGMTMTMEEAISGRSLLFLDRELVRRHRELWNPDSIQDFWTGAAWRDVEANELAYSLALIIMRTIREDLHATDDEVRSFLRAASCEDAGQAAAREHLDVSLGELAGGFLGPGDWEPKPDSWPLRRGDDRDD